MARIMSADPPTMAPFDSTLSARLIFSDKEMKQFLRWQRQSQSHTRQYGRRKLGILPTAVQYDEYQRRVKADKTDHRSSMWGTSTDFGRDVNGSRSKRVTSPDVLDGSTTPEEKRHFEFASVCRHMLHPTSKTATTNSGEPELCPCCVIEAHLRYMRVLEDALDRTDNDTAWETNPDHENATRACILNKICMLQAVCMFEKAAKGERKWQADHPEVNVKGVMTAGEAVDLYWASVDPYGPSGEFRLIDDKECDTASTDGNSTDADEKPHNTDMSADASLLPIVFQEPALYHETENLAMLNLVQSFTPTALLPSNMWACWAKPLNSEPAFDTANTMHKRISKYAGNPKERKRVSFGEDTNFKEGRLEYYFHIGHPRYDGKYLAAIDSDSDCEDENEESSVVPSSNSLPTDRFGNTVEVAEDVNTKVFEGEGGDINSLKEEEEEESDADDQFESEAEEDDDDRDDDDEEWEDEDENEEELDDDEGKFIVFGF